MQLDIAAEVKRAVMEALSISAFSDRRLWSIRNWAKAHDMGLTFVYAEIKSGRLRAVQVGDRMMIDDADGRGYVAKLPELQAA